jgi:Holliday junction resolvase RusA-like endonuclease
MGKNKFSFVVDGLPKAKERPRLGKSGVYTPKKTKAYENQVALLASLAMKKANVDLMHGPVRMDIIVGMKIPKSFSKKKVKQIEEYGMYNIVRPDIDNILKAIGDGLNNIVYKDDSQICEGSFKKIYSKEPQVWVEIQEIDIMLKNE